MRFSTATRIAAIAAALTVAAVAQTAPAPPPAETINLERFVVTGSHIPRTETAAEGRTFPLQIVDRTEIERAGYQRTAELLQKMGVSNGNAVPRSNAGTQPTSGASSVSLRGLGPEATLVLINGRRTASYPIGRNGTLAFVDLNTIPLAAIERVEVLTDGASALYGADAVAGVVNIILRREFTGHTASLRYGNTSGTDSTELTGSVHTGARAGGLELGVTTNYHRRAAIYHRDRGYSATPVAVSMFSSPISVQITRAAYAEAIGVPGASPPGLPAAAQVFLATPGVMPGAGGGNFVPPDGNPVTGSTNRGVTPAEQYLYSIPALSRYNFNQFALTLPEVEQMGVLAAADCRLPGRAGRRFYFDFSLQRHSSEYQLAPAATGFFTTPGVVELVIPARTPSPLPTANGRARAAPAGAFNPFNPFNLDIAGTSRFRMADFGNRIVRDRNDALLGTLGYRAENFAGQWSLDVGLRASEIVSRPEVRTISTSRLNRVLNQADPIFSPASPDYIGSTTAYNPFGYYLNPIPENRAAIAYATVVEQSRHTSTLHNAFLAIDHPAMWTLPGGEVGIAAGVDFRRETLEQIPGPFLRAGDILGGTVNPIANASRGVIAAYAEAQVPLVGRQQQWRLVRELSLNLATRWEKFLDNGQSRAVPKLGLRWLAPGETLALRASFGAGIRQPSLYELNRAPNESLSFSLRDPRTNAQLLELPVLVRGNRDLRSEKTETGNAGLVWSPTGALRHVTFTADWWAVKRDGTVKIDLQNTLNRFFQTAPGGPQPGEAVTRDAAGAITRVEALALNAGETTARGVDLAASYRWHGATWGRLDVSAHASFLDSIRIAELPGVPTREMAGKDFTNAGDDGYLQRKGRVSVGWERRGLALHVSANFTDGFEDRDLAGQPYEIASTWTIDAQSAYSFGPQAWEPLRRTRLTAGATNATNRDPPRALGGGGNGSGYPSNLYTSEGRYIYVALERKF